MNKEIIKEKITVSISKSDMERDEGRFLTFKALVKEFPNIPTDCLIDILNELYNDGFVSFSKGMREKNSGYVYFVKNYKKPILQLEKKTESNKKKIPILNIVFIIILFFGILVSTKYSMDAMTLVGMKVKEMSFIIAFLISSLSIICHAYFRICRGFDKILIGLGLIILITINLFCTMTVIIDDFETERVLIDPNTVKYQIFNEDKKIILNSISATQQQMLIQHELAKKFSNETNEFGNNSRFYERQARQLSIKIEKLNDDLQDLNIKINDIISKNIDIEKKKNSYSIIASILKIDTNLIVVMVAIMLSFIYDIFCPFLIGLIFSLIKK